MCLCGNQISGARRGTWEKYDAPVPKKLVDFTSHKLHIMNKHNETRAPIAMAIEARNVHENHLCPSCLLEHWTYVLTKYNSRFGLRFLDLPATLALLDAKARGEVAVGV